MKISLLFTYRDRAGKVRLRDYVKITFGILLLIAAAGGVGLFNRHAMVFEAMATPRPLDDALIPATIESISEPVRPVEKCPSDPSEWILIDNEFFPNSNLKGLFPECVGAQLEKTAAWFYATTVLGYSRREATNLFGFSNIPMEYHFEQGGISVITDFKDEPQVVNLRFPSDNTGLREWRIGANSQTAVEFSFAGCFRTSSIMGGEITSWGDGYPVVCQYDGDYRTKHYVSDVHGKTLTINGSENLRRLMWFGYTVDGMWSFLGFAKDWQYDLSQINEQYPSTITASVMTRKYGITLQPLPENWSGFTSQEYVDAFLQELDLSE